jgi:serine/threonine-protein kinase RsbW
MVSLLPKGLYMVTICLDADLSDLRTIREFVADAGRELDVDERTVSCLTLAVDEICTNVIKHGYNGHGGRLEVTVDPIRNGVQVTVRDWGRAFDPQAVPIPDVDAPLEERPLGGLGLFLVHNMMDEVQFDFHGDEGNTVTMVKCLKPEGGEG